MRRVAERYVAQGWTIVGLAAAGIVALAAGCGTGGQPVAALPAGLQAAEFSTPVDAGEAKILPTREVAGDPPADGLRYWRRPFYRLEVHGCYVSVLRHPGPDGPGWALWENTWGADAAARSIRLVQGPDFASLGAPEVRISGELIDDVYVPAGPRKLAPKDPPTLSPLRGYTRPHIFRDPEYGYVAFTCVCPDYKPGSVSLFPAILTSPTGEAGSWTYRGMLAGEPAEEQEKRGHPVWSDGGTLLRMPDGSWRAYVNNFGNAAIALLTSETLDGPWRFLRNGDGSIRDLLTPGADGKRRPNCFPHVLRVSETEWHLWHSDGWPVQSIWHWQSRDGVHWQLYGKQPEITRAAVNGHGIKCLRTCLSPDGSTIYGFVSIWDDTDEPGEKGWRLHLLRLPVGLR